MLSRLSCAILLASFLAGTLGAPQSTEPISSCTTGPIQCCDTVEEASSSEVTAILASLGIVLQDLDVLV
ncbi:Hydrophobin [Mycena venus]|uniref:Hydrophobin n=1 Tax=Mycena venus TaxID=2733690 RepID=A0A8H6YRI8_9AGAR|nr:Hydrophobin [Mycena venus]